MEFLALSSNGGHHYSRVLLVKPAVPEEVRDSYIPLDVVTISSSMCQMPGHKTKSTTHAGQEHWFWCCGRGKQT